MPARSLLDNGLRLLQQFFQRFPLKVESAKPFGMSTVVGNAAALEQLQIEYVRLVFLCRQINTLEFTPTDPGTKTNDGPKDKRRHFLHTRLACAAFNKTVPKCVQQHSALTIAGMGMSPI